MFRTIKSIVFSLLVLFALNSCEKEVSVENGVDVTGGSQSGTAVYTLDGAPLLCVTPIINGDYVVGTPLNNTNTVVITVNVGSAGTYLISTGLINGIQFTGSGTFPGTGAQAITLFGSGTPIAAGTNTFVPGTSGCSFLITATTTVITPVTGLYYEANIDGTLFHVDLNGTNGYEGGTALSGTLTDVEISSYIEPATTPFPTGTTAFDLSKGILHNYTTISDATFKDFFAIGSYPYGYDPADGIRISWIDGAGNEWSTSNGTANQTGSAFNITAVADEPGQVDYSVRVTATFNCKLYDNAGNTKTLTGGKYVGIFSKI
jgi:hypothetical protein